jgi:hypothetical protein
MSTSMLGRMVVMAMFKIVPAGDVVHATPGCDRFKTSCLIP